jgi:peptidoglycan/xylan/chitin deacetylase (PgdA/CDA1 family)
VKRVVRAGVKEVALTFDDGPAEWTGPILDLLAEHDAHATFFVLGCNVVDHGDLVARTISEGHELAVHGWDHKPVEQLSQQQILGQLANTCEQIMLNGHTVLRWWRPPWHRTTPEAIDAAGELGLSYCGVTVDGFDVNKTDDWIVNAVYKGVRNGAIIGLHDGVASNGNHETPHRRNTVRAVERLLTTLDSPWRFVTVSELLR